MQYSRVPRILVVDTDVFVSALLGKGASNRIVDACVAAELEPLMGAALLSEYEDVLGRDDLFANCALSRREREDVLDAFLFRCRWVRIYFAWRPNLRDEGDNHLVELAVAGNAEAIVTKNTRDFRVSELRFPGLAIQTPEAFLGGSK